MKKTNSNNITVYLTGKKSILISQLPKLVYFLSIFMLLIFGTCKKEEPDVIVTDNNTIIVKDTVIKFPTDFTYNKIVNGVTPENNSLQVSHKAKPEISFRTSPLLDSIVIDSLSYRIIIDSISLSAKDIAIPIDTLWKNDTILSILPKNYLEPNSQYNLYFKAHYEIDSLGTWIVPYSKPYYEIIDNAFKTVTVSTTSFITENIEYTYPVQNQYHYLQDEFHGGFIQLKTPQNEFFDKAQLKVRISGKSGYSFVDTATYSPENYQISFNMPFDLENETIYALEFIKEVEGSEEVLYSYHFRTSKLNSFEEKAKSFIYMQQNYLPTYPLRPFVHLLYSWYINVPEYFDKFEMELYSGLIRPVLLEKSDEFKKQINHFYKYIDSIDVNFDRNKLSKSEWVRLYYNEAYIKKIANGEIDFNQLIGIPPKECMHFNYVPKLPLDSLCLNEDLILAGEAPILQGGKDYLAGFGIYCTLMDIADFDRNIALDWLIKKYGNSENTPVWVKDIYKYDNVPVSAKTNWYFNLNYTLPNGVITSVVTCRWYGPSN